VRYKLEPVLEAAQVGELTVEWRATTRAASADTKLVRAAEPLGAIATSASLRPSSHTTRRPVQSAWVRYGR
jgi:hypothetical protein